MASGVTCSFQKVAVQKMSATSLLIYPESGKYSQFSCMTALENEVRPPKQFGNGERGRNTPSIP